MKIESGFNTPVGNTLNQHKTTADALLSKIAATKELSGKESADLLISSALGSEISGLTQSVQNANELVGMYQIADASLQAIQAGSEKLSELSVRFHSATLNADQKAGLEKEFRATTQAMQEMANGATYNSQNLLSAQFGLEVKGIDALSINDQEGIASFSKSVENLFSTVSAQQNSAQVGITNALSAITNLTSANASISQTPLDQTLAQLSNEQTKLSASTLASAHQNNLMQQRIAALLG